MIPCRLFYLIILQNLTNKYKEWSDFIGLLLSTHLKKVEIVNIIVLFHSRDVNNMI